MHAWLPGCPTGPRAGKRHEQPLMRRVTSAFRTLPNRAILAEGVRFVLLATQPDDDVDPVDLHPGGSIGKGAHLDMRSGNIQEGIRLLHQEVMVI